VTGPLVVVGDTLLDRDVDGTVDRICPDAPAPVLAERTASDRPGGAGLAALLAAADGFDVVLVTALAADAGGARLVDLLGAAGVTVFPLPLAGATPEKIRLRARGQTLLRLDRGGGGQPPGEPDEAALRAIATARAVLVSDYGRGVADQPALRRALADATAPVVWDPHPRGPAAVAGVRLLTPNEAELHRLVGGPDGAVAGVGPAGSRLAAAAQHARSLRDRWRAGAVVVTLGADGALLCHGGPTPLVVPVSPAMTTDGDTCGAGDRFAAAATGALAQGALVSEAVQTAVAAASSYVAGGGPANLPVDRRDRSATITTGSATPDPARFTAGAPDGRSAAPSGEAEALALATRVRASGGTVVATGGCFDLLHTGHLATLQAARSLGDCLIVCLNSDRSVAGLKGPDRPVTRQADRARLLSALNCVDAVVVFDESTPNAVLGRIRPDIWVKGGDYSGEGGAGNQGDLPEAELLRRWGGQTVLVPYLDGRSTTATIAAARNGTSHARTRVS
jgi:rfaE bifunctional protein nucleotidyltransferase chain/domain/rfaE bifunctional protein kinase chain/domain